MSENWLRLVGKPTVNFINACGLKFGADKFVSCSRNLGVENGGLCDCLMLHDDVMMMKVQLVKFEEAAC